jgi:signal transduction histidine kinase
MTLKLLEQRLASYNVSVELIRKKTLPEVMTDPEQLKEVLVNLMINACEAMNDSQGMIIISEDIMPEQHCVVINVWDNGSGIPRSVREKIFQPFFTTKEEGTGLGLSIAERIITEHGGKLEVESYEGRGTTFMITLPLIKTDCRTELKSSSACLGL